VSLLPRVLSAFVLRSGLDHLSYSAFHGGSSLCFSICTGFFGSGDFDLSLLTGDRDLLLIRSLFPVGLSERDDRFLRWAFSGLPLFRSRLRLWVFRWLARMSSLLSEELSPLSEALSERSPLESEKVWRIWYKFLDLKSRPKIRNLCPSGH
jgi:hypothetical protein